MTFDARIEHSLPRGKGGITRSGGHQHLDTGMMLTYQRTSMSPSMAPGICLHIGKDDVHRLPDAKTSSAWVAVAATRCFQGILASQHLFGNELIPHLRKADAFRHDKTADQGGGGRTPPLLGASPHVMLAAPVVVSL
jgi:hypothetical protein